MGTYAPGYSRSLEADVLATGGAYVEAPVSGSRRPAETGDLVAMLAGADAAVVERVRALIAPLVQHSVEVWSRAVGAKHTLAVNSSMITMLNGLAEAVHSADGTGWIASSWPRCCSVGRSPRRCSPPSSRSW